MRIHQHRVANADLIQRNVGDLRPALDVRHRGHALGERMEDGGGAADGVTLQCFTARKHQHNQCTREVFTQQRGGYNRDAGEQV